MSLREFFNKEASRHIKETGTSRSASGRDVRHAYMCGVQKGFGSLWNDGKTCPEEMKQFESDIHDDYIERYFIVHISDTNDYLMALRRRIEGKWGWMVSGHPGSVVLVDGNFYNVSAWMPIYTPEELEFYSGEDPA